jgi:hypothetical protein
MVEDIFWKRVVFVQLALRTGRMLSPLSVELQVAEFLQLVPVPDIG